MTRKLGTETTIRERAQAAMITEQEEEHLYTNLREAVWIVISFLQLFSM
jgi:hypothetical protein